MPDLFTPIVLLCVIVIFEIFFGILILSALTSIHNTVFKLFKLYSKKNYPEES